MRLHKVALARLAFTGLAVCASINSISLAQVNSYTWVADLFKNAVYKDRFNDNDLLNIKDPYPYMSIPVFASGDSHVSTWGPLVPFLTGVSIFQTPNHPNTDPIVIVGAYNYAETSGLKVNPSEPSAGIYLETNYLVPNTYYRQMEWYLSFRTTAGNPGAEYRPITMDYAPDTGDLTGSSISAASRSWGANLDFRAPYGSNSGTRFAQLGWSGSGGGNICGFQHLGSFTEDTLIDIQAQGAQNSIIRIGAMGATGVGRWRTLSTNLCSLSVGNAESYIKMYDTGFNSGGSVAINTNNNGNKAGLLVSTSAVNLPSIVGRAIAGQTAPLFRLVDSTNSDPSNNTGEVFSVDTAGRTYTKVGSIAAGTAQNSSILSAAFSTISNGGGGRGVTLPPAVTGLTIRGYISGSSATNLWPGSGAIINGLGSNQALSISANKPFTAIAYDATHWAVQVGA